VETVLDDFDVSSVKTGMLANGGVVAAVACLAEQDRLPRLVVDPVLVSSTGHPLLEPEGVAAYLERLLPRALVATPNLREAAVLGGTTVEALVSLEARIGVAEAIRERGAGWVVVKGGHLTDSADDVVVGPEGVTVLPSPRVETGNDHGTGCSLSAAIAARLALGDEVPDAITAAKAFVHRALAGSAGWRLGAGHGPLDHFGWSARP
jgi:hydroxymethylpyrimidine kinase/phosphomethylpyrimidine kinase